MNYPNRKTTRLSGYDYSQGGAYFCTVCVHRVHKHKPLFGHVEGDQMHLNRFGDLVETCWIESLLHRPSLALDEFQVMPNHVHVLLFLNAPVQTQSLQVTFGPRMPQSLSSVMAGFKSDVSKVIGRLGGEKPWCGNRVFTTASCETNKNFSPSAAIFKTTRLNGPTPAVIPSIPISSESGKTSRPTQTCCRDTARCVR